jgi:RES domain-containing protein
MPTLWRLYRARYGPGLDGIGATFAGGRWHTRGARVVYFGASAAIVVLERLAHVDPDLFPDDLVLAQFDLPESAEQTRVVDLPARWTHNEAGTRRIGDQWRQDGASCLLIVPSAVLPEESNFLLNPEHPAAQSLRLIRRRPFAFDPRLI